MGNTGTLIEQQQDEYDQPWVIFLSSYGAAILAGLLYEAFMAKYVVWPTFYPFLISMLFVFFLLPLFFGFFVFSAVSVKTTQENQQETGNDEGVNLSISILTISIVVFLVFLVLYIYPHRMNVMNKRLGQTKYDFTTATQATSLFGKVKRKYRKKK